MFLSILMKVISVMNSYHIKNRIQHLFSITVNRFLL